MEWQDEIIEGTDSMTESALGPDSSGLSEEDIALKAMSSTKKSKALTSEEDSTSADSDMSEENYQQLESKEKEKYGI